MSQKSKVILLVKTLTEYALTMNGKKREQLADKLRILNDQLTPDVEKQYTTVYCRPLTFFAKEVARMPRTFTKSIGEPNELQTHVRKRYYITQDYELTIHYEIRYRANGYSVTASANTLAKAKKRFIHKLFCMYCTKGASNNE